jgi:hypothetical protein
MACTRRCFASKRAATPSGCRLESGIWRERMRALSLGACSISPHLDGDEVESEYPAQSDPASDGFCGLTAS